MLIEGHIWDKSLHHYFHLPPASELSAALKKEMCSKLQFLPKAASHKLYCNYPCDEDFYHVGHLGHRRSLPSPFQLPATGQIQTHLSSTPAHPPLSFYFLFEAEDFLFFFSCFFSHPLRYRQQHPNHGRCWKDIKAAVFCFQKATGASRLRFQADSGSEEVQPAWGGGGRKKEGKMKSVCAR